MVDTYATARAMVADLQAKRVSATELLTAHLAQNERIVGWWHGEDRLFDFAAAVEDGLGGFRRPSLRS